MNDIVRLGRFLLRGIIAVTGLMGLAYQDTIAQPFQKVYDYQPNVNSSTESIQQTQDNGYISVGYHKLQDGTTEIILCKTRANGTLQWMKALRDQIGTTVNDMPFAVREVLYSSTVQGYIVVGTRVNSSGLNEILAVFADFNGNVLWRRWYTGLANTNAVAYNVEVIDNGALPYSFVLTGYMDADFSSGLCRNQVIFLMKLNDLGVVSWVRKYGILHNDPAKEDLNVGFALQQVWGDPDGFVITGYTNPTGKVSGADKGITVIRTNINGALLWGKTFSGPANTFGDRYSIGKSIKVMTNAELASEFIITGPINTYASPSVDAFLLKLNTAGNLMWFRTYDLFYTPGIQPTENYGFDLQITPNGNYTIAGVLSLAPLGVGPNEWAWLMEVNATTRNPLWAWTYGLRDIAGSWTFQNTDREVGVTLDLCSDDGYIMEGDPENLVADGFYHIRTNAVGQTDGCYDPIQWRTTDYTPTSKKLIALNTTYSEHSMLHSSELVEPFIYDCVTAHKPARPTESPDISESVSVYPSLLKSGEEFNVRCAAAPGSAIRITVVDALGRSVYEQEAQATTTTPAITLSTEGWAVGTYFIRIASGDRTDSRNIIVE